mgnify:CR=1 FL=1
MALWLQLRMDDSNGSLPSTVFMLAIRGPNFDAYSKILPILHQLACCDAELKRASVFLSISTRTSVLSLIIVVVYAKWTVNG